jgi:hypothetical protein
MKSGSYDLLPPQGWEAFVRTEEVESFLWDQLHLVERGGIWRYYNFTSGSSIWDSDTTPGQSVCLDYANIPNETPLQFEHLTFVLTADDSEHYRQLVSVAHHLVSHFGLRISPSTNGTQAG